LAGLPFREEMAEFPPCSFLTPFSRLSHAFLTPLSPFISPPVFPCALSIVSVGKYPVLIPVHLQASCPAEAHQLGADPPERAAVAESRQTAGGAAHPVGTYPEGWTVSPDAAGGPLLLHPPHWYPLAHTHSPILRGLSHYARY
jgi:hypothetical protein